MSARKFGGSVLSPRHSVAKRSRKSETTITNENKKERKENNKLKRQIRVAILY